jgi:isochorismatase family protein
MNIPRRIAWVIFVAGAAGGIALQKYSVPRLLLHEALGIYHTYAATNGRPANMWPLVIHLPTRKFVQSAHESTYDTEADSSYTYRERRLDLKRTAVIVIDPWENHDNDGWLGRAKENMRSKLRPFLELIRHLNVPIVYAPHEQEIARVVEPREGDFVVNSQNQLDDTEELNAYLRARNIATLLYAGYATNKCLLTRPTGIVRMKRLGYDIILVRDCTIAFEMPETLHSEAAKLITVNLIENNYGETTTLADLRTAFEQATIRK